MTSRIGLKSIVWTDFGQCNFHDFHSILWISQLLVYIIYVAVASDSKCMQFIYIRIPSLVLNPVGTNNTKSLNDLCNGGKFR